MVYSSVLVAVSGEPCDDDAVKLGCELVNASRGNLHILYVIEVERGLPLDAEVPPSTARGEQVLQHLEDIARALRCKPDAELLQSRRAGFAVVQEAVDKEIDTIILAASYSDRFGSFSLGDTIPYVLKNAPCRVIILREEMAETSSNSRTS